MADRFEEWVVLELLGHRRLAGYLSEQQVAGAGFLRLDVPSDQTCSRCDGAGAAEVLGTDGEGHRSEDPCTACRGYGTALIASQLYSPSSVYCITPTSEETARAVARLSRPAPVQRWELPAAPAAAVSVPDMNDDGDRFEGEGPF